MLDYPPMRNSPSTEQTLNSRFDGANTRYDKDFKRVQGLTWLPWVGERYPQRLPQKRLLVVGQSHYFKGNTDAERQADRKEYRNNRNWTRKVAYHALYLRDDWATKTLRILPELLLGPGDIGAKRLWRDSAFYNFIQRPLDKHANEQPSLDDFLRGWRVFAEVVKIVKPSHCFFIGVTAANSFHAWITSQTVFSGSVSMSEEDVNGTYPRTGKLELVSSGVITELIFVKHLAQFKPIDCGMWRQYLLGQHADFMDWLTNES